MSAFEKENTLDGINLSSLEKNNISEAKVEVCKETEIISSSGIIYDIDLLIGI